MATASFTSSRTPIFSPAGPTNRRITAPSAQSNGWLRPLFGWASEPDYINNGIAKIEIEMEADRVDPKAEKNLFRGCFTEEKAKELRRKTAGSAGFHDIMYHSAIASRLASDV